jgi:hypothetical protein
MKKNIIQSEFKLVLFGTGFVVGALFSYSGILGFLGGFTGGFLFKTYLNEREAERENTREAEK